MSLNCGGRRVHSARYGSRWFHSGLLGSFGHAIGVVGFIWGCCVISGASKGSFVRALGVVGIIRALSWGRQVQSGSLAGAPRGSLFAFGRALAVIGFVWARSGGRPMSRSSGSDLGVVLFIWECSWVRRIHWGWLGSLWCGLVVVSAFPVRSVPLGAPLELSGSFRFIWTSPRCRRVHFRSLGTFGSVMGS